MNDDQEQATWLATHRHLPDVPCFRTCPGWSSTTAREPDGFDHRPIDWPALVVRGDGWRDGVAHHNHDVTVECGPACQVYDRRRAGEWFGLDRYRKVATNPLAVELPRTLGCERHTRWCEGVDHSAVTKIGREVLCSDCRQVVKRDASVSWMDVPVAHETQDLAVCLARGCENAGLPPEPVGGPAVMLAPLGGWRFAGAWGVGPTPSVEVLTSNGPQIPLFSPRTVTGKFDLEILDDVAWRVLTGVQRFVPPDPDPWRYRRRSTTWRKLEAALVGPPTD